MKKLLKISIGAAMLCGVASLVSTASADQLVTTPNGAWAAYPGQAAAYEAAVQPPINADGSSNFKARNGAVIPIKFAVLQSAGPLVFESTSTGYPYSYLQWQPNESFTFSQLVRLSANYTFTDGDCHAGSLRWDVFVMHDGQQKHMAIYYGNPNGSPNPPGQSCTDAYSESGVNLISSSTAPANRFEMMGGWGQPGSPMYTTYEDALASTNNGNDVVVYIQLTLDSGDQVVSLTSATVEVGNDAPIPYIETFTPQETSPTPVCPTSQATIGITKTSTSPDGTEFQPISIQPNDTDGVFRIVDCNYMYNLATSFLMGSGDYHVVAHINSQTLDVADFSLR